MNYAKLEAWRLCAAQLDTLKKQEMELRKALVTETFTSTLEGAHSIELDAGWTLKMTQPYTRSLDQAKMPEVLKALKKLKANGAIKVKYDLSVAAYKALEGAARACIDEVLTTTPGSPSLELVAPKGTV